MPNDVVLTEEELQIELATLPEWELRDGWLRRKYKTPGFAHTMLLANMIGFIAEAAWHHPDLELGYAHVTVKLQTHSARGITQKDISLAHTINNMALWKPTEGSTLEGFPKKWIS